MRKLHETGGSRAENISPAFLASSRSERDTYSSNTIENRGCLFIYIYGRTYVILYFDPPYFCVRSAFDLVPNFTKKNPPV